MRKTIYFVRHCQPNYHNPNDKERELSQKGEADCQLIEAFFADKAIDAIYSSPYKRAYDTIKSTALKKNLTINLVDDFRERKIDDTWIDDFDEFSRRQWQDFSYRLANGESLAQVQTRNIHALWQLLTNQYRSMMVGTHGTALSTIIHYYQPTFGYVQFCQIKSLFPFIVKLSFDHLLCQSIVFYDVFDKNNEYQIK